MTKEQITEKVLEVISRTMNLTEHDKNLLHYNTNLLYGWSLDELDIIEIMVHCQKYFGIQIEDDIAFGVDSVNELVDIIYLKIN